MAGTFKRIAGDNLTCSFWIGLTACTLVQCFLRKITVSPTNLKTQEAAVLLEMVITDLLLVILL